MNYLPKDPNGAPFLFLAPMEGVGDLCFRKAMASIGGFDQAVREFLRVPKNAHVKSLASVFDAKELGQMPLVAQVMGSDPDLMAEMALELQNRGAPRIDLNCGCPSNTVTGRGAGSSLLKEPKALYTIAKAMKAVLSIPFSIKMRSGYEDTSLFEENLLAAEESGACYITLHPRTKTDGYGPPAKWELIAKAKELLKIPVVGNGDILNVNHALNMLQATKCDALMIGRGSVINPFIFHQIKAHFSQKSYHPKWEDIQTYFSYYLDNDMAPKVKINKLKQILSFQFRANAELLSMRPQILTAQHATPEAFLDFALPLLKQGLGL